MNNNINIPSNYDLSNSQSSNKNNQLNNSHRRTNSTVMNNISFQYNKVIDNNLYNGSKILSKINNEINKSKAEVMENDLNIIPNQTKLKIEMNYPSSVLKIKSKNNNEIPYSFNASRLKSLIKSTNFDAERRKNDNLSNILAYCKQSDNLNFNDNLDYSSNFSSIKVNSTIEAPNTIINSQRIHEDLKDIGSKIELKIQKNKIDSIVTKTILKGNKSLNFNASTSSNNKSLFVTINSTNPYYQKPTATIRGDSSTLRDKSLRKNYDDNNNYNLAGCRSSSNFFSAKNNYDYLPSNNNSRSKIKVQLNQLE